jgi:hypothetical protein
VANGLGNESCVSPKLYVRRSPRRLEVFGDPAGTLPIGNRTLEDVQEEAARAANLRIERLEADDPRPLVPPYFLAEDDTFFTTRYLAEFVQRARALGKNCRAGVAEHPVFARTIAAHPRAVAVEGGWVFDLRYVADGESEAFDPVCLALDDLDYATARVPTALRADEKMTNFETSLSLFQVQAPVHLYLANMHKNAERLRELFLSATRASWHMRPNTSLDARGNLIAGRVSIHPTACVEGSVLQDGVVLGPQVICRYSILGEGVTISEQSVVHRSVIGRFAQMHMQCRLVHSVMLEQSFLSETPFQFSLLGRSSALFAITPTDWRFDGSSITTKVGGEVVDSGLPFLGLLAGHRVKMTCLVTAPGRIVPNDSVVLPNPSTVYRGHPEDHPAGTTLFVG